MASAQSTPSPVYIFTLRQRAGLQLLTNALQFAAARCTDADRDAAVILWATRERILQAAARRRMPHLRRLYREAMQIV